jgi:hypothetical protein
LFRQVTACAADLARLSTAKSNAASKAMIAITTSNSISVKARVRGMGNSKLPELRFDMKLPFVNRPEYVFSRPNTRN